MEKLLYLMGYIVAAYLMGFLVVRLIWQRYYYISVKGVVWRTLLLGTGILMVILAVLNA